MDEAQARADFERALASHQPGFGQFFLAKLLGLEIIYGEDACTVAFTVADWMFNPQGTLHGGVIATVLDISMGHLLKHFSGFGTTLEMKIQYLRPARSGRILSRAVFLRRGRTVSFLESRMMDEEGRVVAVATSTWQKLPDTPPAGVTP